MNKVSPLRSMVGDRRFFAATGEVYGSIEELAQGIASMELSKFTHHVTLEKNDFASWLRDCFGESDLARAIASSKSPHSMVLKLKRRIGQR